MKPITDLMEYHLQSLGFMVYIGLEQLDQSLSLVVYHQGKILGQYPIVLKLEEAGKPYSHSKNHSFDGICVYFVPTEKIVADLKRMRSEGKI